MSLLKNIPDKGAVLAWSRLSDKPHLVALGTKDSAGSGFDDYGGELEMHKVDFSDAKSTDSILVGKAKATSRFASIAWSEMALQSTEYNYGLIAGGMIDGTINLWNPSFLCSPDSTEDSLIGSVAQHQGAIHGLQFNPHRESSHLLGTGGADGEVYVMALDRPDTPNVFVPAPPPSQSKHIADITRVAWNTQVAHILASSAQNGQCIVWDLRQKKAWCELRDPTGGAISDIAWNPDQGLHFVTAGGDDKNPVIKLWDLRSSTSLPLATLQGHTEGVLSVSWCPTDTSLLLSCGKDNRTLLWDLFHLQPAYELPTASPSLRSASNDTMMFGGAGVSGGGFGEQSEQSVFGGLATSAGNRRYQVNWSPCLPAVISACSFDSLSGAKSKLGRAPKWLRKPVGASFGFGGKLVSFDNKSHGDVTVPQPGKRAATGNVRVSVSQVVDNPDLAVACDSFHMALSTGNLKELCEQKAASASSPHDSQIWTLMKIICFEKNAREMLLSHLGFDGPSIEAAAQAYVTSKSTGVASDVFGGGDKSVSCGGSDQEIYAAAEPAIRNALVIGNFAAAVDCCVEAGMMAEALLLAQCGEPDLWTKTQAIFFDRFRNKKPFLNILHAVINNQLMELVMASDLSRWRETLAIVNTYGKSEEFGELCEALAGRLAEEARDPASATLCYMCANNVPKAIAYWVDELKNANAYSGCVDTKALQMFIEKVVVYVESNKAADEAGGSRMAGSSETDMVSIQKLVPACSEYFAAYSNLLASQGRLELAPGYLRGQTQDECILRDRLYHAGGPKRAGSRPPQFPFARVNIASPKQANATNGIPSVAAAATRQQSAAVNQRQGSPGGAHGNRGAASFSAAHSPQQVVSSSASQPVSSPAFDNSGGLPAGWLQLTDPGSGRAYYFNQATNQSQWEPPQQPQQVALVQTSQQVSLAHVAAQPNPVVMQGAQPAVVMQGTQAVATAQLQEQLTAAIEPVVVATGESVGFMRALDDVIQSLFASATPADKRQLQAVVAGQSLLQKKMNANEISSDIVTKVEAMVMAIANRNFNVANSVQMDLVNTAWTQHKDWIKVFKVLIQMVSKK